MIMQLKRRKQLLMIPLVGLFTSGVIAEESKIDEKLAMEAPLFERAKMRGSLRDDVSLDVVKQTPGDGYQSRVVEWWPKKGVDLIAEPEGEPRTWTINQEKPEEGNDANWWPKTLRGKTQLISSQPP